MPIFDPNIFGDPLANAALPEDDMRSLVLRAQRRARYAKPPANAAEIEARATDQADLACEIVQALNSGDRVRAQALVSEGSALFGDEWMERAVYAAAREVRFAELAPLRDQRLEPDHDADDISDCTGDDIDEEG